MGIELTYSEIKLIVTALAAISPSGGGSDTYTLYRKLAPYTSNVNDEDVVAAQRIAAKELADA